MRFNKQVDLERRLHPLACKHEIVCPQAVQIGPLAPLPSGKFGGASGKEREMAWRAEQVTVYTREFTYDSKLKCYSRIY